MKRFPRIRHSLILLSFIVLLFGFAPQANGKEAYRKSLADHFGKFLAQKLNSCKLCHVAEKPTEEEWDHNVFGARLKAIKGELKKAGKDTDILNRLRAIENEDSDGDGVSNLNELLSGRFPGDATDKPTAEEVQTLAKVVAEYQAFRDAYPWTPFRKVEKPALPTIKNAGWVRNPIDAFIAAEHEKRGLKPSPEAPKTTLLRRLYLDLTGLPPTRAELHAFLTDPSSDAYEKVVERLLSSPRYGERWGRHWMDVWRYCDYNGDHKEVKFSMPHIWRWRDWIIESLNEDKGYDRMVVEMLAADELAPNDASALRATGYLARNYSNFFRESWMQETVEHTSQAFLGVRLMCARCHNHMYDDIKQKEYYQVRAVFEPYFVRTDRVPGEQDTKKNGLVRVFDAYPDAQTYFHKRGDERLREGAPLPPGVPQLLGGHFERPVLVQYGNDLRVWQDQSETARTVEVKSKVRALGALGFALSPNAFAGLYHRLAVPRACEDLILARDTAQLAEAHFQVEEAIRQVQRLELASQQQSDEWTKTATNIAQWQRQIAAIEARIQLHQAELAVVRAGADEIQGPLTRVALAHARQSFNQAEQRLQLPPSTNYEKPLKPSTTFTSTGRRLAFARWIADRENPLTARVAMNHIWLRHFGQAIVPSVFDFGRNGQPASHPALLDWLSAEFMDQGWKMKTMHRLIVTSNTYRMDSTIDTANLPLDRDNKYLWHGIIRRVEAEVIRDSMFQVAGTLDLTMGGPEIHESNGWKTPRRSVYFHHSGERQMEFAALFNGPSATECYSRSESTVPQQALAMMNDEAILELARVLAKRLGAETNNDDSAFTTTAFEQILSRGPTAAESKRCLDYLRQTQDVQPGQRRESLVHVLLNHHEFVTIR